MGLDLGKVFGGGVGSEVQGTNQWGTFGTLVGATGDLMRGVGNSQQYNYMASIADMNSQIMQQNSAAASAAGAQESSAIKMRFGQLEGSQKAAQGANNVDVNIGSPAAVRGATAAVGDLDSALAQFNANRQAFSDTIQSQALKAQSGAYKRAGFGALTSGMFGAANTLLGGASSLASKWAQFTTAGAAGGGTTSGSLLNADIKRSYPVSRSDLYGF